MSVQEHPYQNEAETRRLGLFFGVGFLGVALGALGIGVMLAVAQDKSAWYLTRASGTVAYLLLSGSTVWGLLLSSKLLKEWVPPALALALHSALSWLALGVAGFHAWVLLFDRYYDYHLVHLLVPFQGPYRPEWVGLGILGLYGVLITTLSFPLRRWLGQARWRRLHYLTFPLYILVTAHGLLAGTDSSGPGMRALYLLSVLVVLFLTHYRILSAPHKPTSS